MKILRKFLQNNIFRNNFCCLNYFPGENHRDLDDSLVSVRVEIGTHFPLLDDILTKLLLAFVYEFHRIELCQTVISTRDVVVQPTVLTDPLKSKYIYMFVPLPFLSNAE